jgi:hypothetical protein
MRYYAPELDTGYESASLAYDVAFGTVRRLVDAICA